MMFGIFFLKWLLVIEIYSFTGDGKLNKEEFAEFRFNGKKKKKNDYFTLRSGYLQLTVNSQKRLNGYLQLTGNSQNTLKWLFTVY